MTATRVQSLGFISLGTMGSPMAANVARAGFSLTVWNRTPSKARAVVPGAMGSRVFHMGPVGTGTTIKLAVNSIVYGLSEALSEALVLAERAGIERDRAYGVFASSAIAAPFVEYRKEAFLTAGGVPVAFRMVLAEKDLDLVLALAARVEALVPQGHLNPGVISEAIAAGFADHDMSAIAERLRTAEPSPDRNG